MQPNPRERWFNHLTRLTIHHPKRIIASALLFAGISLALIPGLEVSTSRQGLVERENPYQQRLLKFLDQFGDPTSPVFFVISGGRVDDRRQTVDHLVAALEKDYQFRGKTLARLGPEQVAEALLLQSKETLNEFQALAPSDVDLSTFVEGGLPAYTSALQIRLANLASALQMRMVMPFGAGAIPEQVSKAVQKVETLARTTDAYLAGEPPWAHIQFQNNHFSMVDAAGYIMGQGSDYLLVSVFPQFGGDEVMQQKPIIERLREIRDEVMDSPARNSTIQIQLTGLPTLAVDELQIIKEGLSKSSVATGLGIFILFLLAFRSLRQSLFAGIPLLVGIISTLAFVRLAFGQLNLITSSFISVLLGLGIDFPVHLLARFNEARHKGNAVAASIKQSLTKTGPGILTGALTTILAFLTTTTTEFTAFAELGIITAVGLVLMVVATFVLLPTLIYPLESKRDRVQSRIPDLPQLLSIIRSAPRLVLFAGVIAAVSGALNIDQIRFNYRYFDFLPQETESAQALRMLENDLAMGPTFANISASSVQEARQLTRQLRALPSVASVQTATDLLPPLTDDFLASLNNFYAAFPSKPNFDQIARSELSPDDLAKTINQIAIEINKIQKLLKLSGQSTEATASAFEALFALHTRLESMGSEAQPLLDKAAHSIGAILERAWGGARNVSQRGSYLPSDLPPTLKQRFVSEDERKLAIYVYPKGDIWNRQFASSFARDLEKLAPTVSGFAITLHAHSSMILSGFKRAALLAGILILLLLLYDFRNLPDALLALLPTTIGWLWMLGIMSSWDIAFNVANIVVLPLVLGIGIDAGVHMVHRYKESSRANGVALLSDLVSGTGSAVLLSAFTTIVGFAGLLLADYGGMQSLGLVMVLGISCCLVACLLILPAILIVLGRAK